MIKYFGGGERGKQELSSIASRFRHYQYRILQVMSGAFNSTDAQLSFADPYTPIALELEGSNQPFYCEWRDFINGTRMDKEDLSKWTKASFEKMLEIDGKMIALAFLGQFANLNLSDYILTRRADDKITPLSVTHLSASGSFCNSLGCDGYEGYIAAAAKVYGNHISSWVQDCLYRENVSANLDLESRKDLRQKLISICLESFEDALNEISKIKDDALGELLEEVRKEFEGKADIPEPINLPKFLDLTQRLNSMSESARRGFASQVFKQARSLCEITDGIGALERAKVPQQETWASVRSCIDAAATLIGGHISDIKRYELIVKHLSDLPKKFSLLSAEERAWSLTVQDLLLRCAELSFKSIQCAAIINHFRKDHFNFNDDLYAVFTRTWPKLNLSPHSVSMLSEAIVGLSRAQHECKDQKRQKQLLAAFDSIDREIYF
jgi:hypothetical protein